MLKVRLFILTCVISMLCGCGAVALFGIGSAAGVAGLKYYEGTLTVVFDASLEDTWDASIKSFKELGFVIESSKHDLTLGKIKGKTPDKKLVSISVKYLTSRQTEGVIRVGIFGDESASRIIMNKIKNILSRKEYTG